MNKAGKLQGRGINAHLNAAGVAQAQSLGHFVRNVPFDTVTSSSLYRAHEVRYDTVRGNILFCGGKYVHTHACVLCVFCRRGSARVDNMLIFVRL